MDRDFFLVFLEVPIFCVAFFVLLFSFAEARSTIEKKEVCSGFVAFLLSLRLVRTDPPCAQSDHLPPLWGYTPHPASRFRDPIAEVGERATKNAYEKATKERSRDGDQDSEKTVVKNLPGIRNGSEG